MTNTKLILTIITLPAILSSVITGSEQITRATQRLPSPIPLLRAKCVKSGPGSVRTKEQNVSIGRAVYTSLFHLGPGIRSAAMTCKIQPDGASEPVFETLNLGFGMRDNDSSSPPIIVNIYLDGNRIEPQQVKPSEAKTVTLKVGDVRNVQIEALCSNPARYCDRVYFFEASLEKKLPPAPLTPPTPQASPTPDASPTPQSSPTPSASPTPKVAPSLRKK